MTQMSLKAHFHGKSKKALLTIARNDYRFESEKTLRRQQHLQKSFQSPNSSKVPDTIWKS